MRILIADDHQDAALSLADLLGTLMNEQVTTTVAFDGTQAVEAAEARRPDVALLDIGMPKMDGLMAAHRVRQLYGRQVVIAAMSGQQEHVLAALESGDFDYAFRKPLSAEQLSQLMKATAAALENRARCSR
ncbi:response regulator [Aquincola sp. J276]|uniref:response regulator n=1 Tax=Aquincola sp. J276 TaxID=2898432 RepID=UPI0021508F87|nr:response regulator [Aquincola sp. J276]MCR5864066.1 response regulator [Aquincola sp. J276]